MNRVIVIGGNHHNTLGILRSFGEKDILSTLILVDSSKNPYVKYSRYIYRLYHLSDWTEIIDVLKNIIDNLQDKPVVISCADPATFELDLHYNELSSLCYLPLGKKQGDIVQLMDKGYMTQVAEKIGLIVPRSFYSIDEIVSDKTVNYPIIVKPITSVFGHKSDIKILNNRHELESYIKDKHGLKVQYQEFVKKEIEFQLIGCSLGAGEHVIIPGASIILRQPKETNTGYLRYSTYNNVCTDELISLCKTFVKKIGYSGLFSMEFLKDTNGKYYFMEINMRNDGNSICVTESGMNLPYIWYAYNCGLDYLSESYRPIRDVLVMPEFSDFFLALFHYKIGFFNWLKDVKRTNRFMEYDSQDKRPFFVLLLQYMKYSIQKIFKR